MIYTFGNSHAHLFTNTEPGLYGKGNCTDNFCSISLGPVIAYNFIDNHYNDLINFINSQNIDKEKDYILLVIGEVDCRWHLPYQSNLQKREIFDIVKECIDRFFITHIRLKELGYNVISWSGHPSTTSSHNDDPSSPVFGECITRNNITKIYDSIIKDKSIENQIENVSIIDELINTDGLTKMEYFSDYCHLDYNKTIDIINRKFEKYYDTNITQR